MAGSSAPQFFNMQFPLLFNVHPFLPPSLPPSLPLSLPPVIPLSLPLSLPLSQITYLHRPHRRTISNVPHLLAALNATFLLPVKQVEFTDATP